MDWILSVFSVGVFLVRMYGCCVMATDMYEVWTMLSMVLYSERRGEDIWSLHIGHGQLWGLWYAFDGVVRRLMWRRCMLASQC